MPGYNAVAESIIESGGCRSCRSHEWLCMSLCSPLQLLEPFLKSLDLFSLKLLFQSACLSDSRLAFLLELENLDLSRVHPAHNLLHLLISIGEGILQLGNAGSQVVNLN